MNPAALRKLPTSTLIRDYKTAENKIKKAFDRREHPGLYPHMLYLLGQELKRRKSLPNQ